MVRAVKSACPEIASMAMVAEPTQFGRHVRVSTTSREELIKTVEWVNARAHQSGLAKRLEAHWENMHHPAGAVDLDEPELFPRKRKCCAAGICLCSDEGVEVEKRANKFVNLVRLLCRTRVGFKQDLARGFIVVRLFGRPKSLDDYFAEDEGLVEAWWHIGHMVFSPTEPCFMEVRPCDDPGEVEPSSHRVYLESVGEFPLLYQGFDKFRKSHTISAKWYRIEEANRPIAKFLPQPVPALLLAGFAGGAQQWWPRRLAARRNADDAGDGADSGGEDKHDAGEVAEEFPEDPEEPEVEFDLPEPEFLDLLVPLLDAYDDAPDFVCGDPTDVPSEEPPLPAPPVDPPLPVPASAKACPPPPTPDVPRTRARKHDKGEVMFVLETGTIHYHRSNGNFEARCLKHEGERCTLTRAGPRDAGSSADTPATRRPVGLLAAWLACGPLAHDKEAHKNKEDLARLAGPDGFEFRRDERERVKTLPGAEEVLRRESGQPAGSGEEPDVVR